MKSIRCTLLSDGSSDQMLMPILEWLLCQHCPELAVESAWADLGRLRMPPKTLPSRVLAALDLYPCDLLFIHRDAEKERYDVRHTEIRRALDGLDAPPAICVVPVRMLEAWFLFDELAIRTAAGNPCGRNLVNLPNMNTIEDLPDPKEILFNLLRDSSGRHGARLKKLNLYQCAFRVSQSVDDFTPLRRVPSFQALEYELATMLVVHGWKA